MTRIVTTTYRYKPPLGKRKAMAVPEVRDKKRRAAPRAAAVDEPAPAPHPANDERKAALVTARTPGKRYRDVPDRTPEEHKRRGNAADALFREIKRRITAKLAKDRSD